MVVYQSLVTFGVDVMKRLFIIMPVLLVAGYVLVLDHGSDQMSSAEYAIGRMGSDLGSMFSAMAGQFSAWLSG